MRFEEFKWKRIERIRNDVGEYGDGILNVDELSSVYNFRIDKFQVPQVIDTLWHLKTRDMLLAVWFIFSRKRYDVAVQYLEVCKLLDELKYLDAVRESAVKGILRGVAAHHAPLWKSFIEELFQKGLAKVVFSTETLAAGINMPARMAVISSLSKRSESGRIQLTTNELLQMAGRAGRRCIDKTGHAVVVQTPYEGAEECCKLHFSWVTTACFAVYCFIWNGSQSSCGCKSYSDTE
ncbi:putative RNA helicase [Helianthus annuus]|nr:putative RNA helicase [Helianthus annuus]